jgi:hypothetical protein
MSMFLAQSRNEPECLARRSDREERDSTFCY